MHRIDVRNFVLLSDLHSPHLIGTRLLFSIWDKNRGRTAQRAMDHTRLAKRESKSPTGRSISELNYRRGRKNVTSTIQNHISSPESGKSTKTGVFHSYHKRLLFSYFNHFQQTLNLFLFSSSFKVSSRWSCYLNYIISVSSQRKESSLGAFFDALENQEREAPRKKVTQNSYFQCGLRKSWLK